MSGSPLPPRDALVIGFAHSSYQLATRFAQRDTGVAHFEVRTAGDLRQRLADADVLVISGLWQNEYLDASPRLRFVQSISAGLNQYDQSAFAARHVRLASAQGVNEIAVAEHAMALMLALKRHIHIARDNQSRQYWRPMIADIARREDELAGKTLLIVGYGRIGARLARLGKAFDMRVIGVRRNPTGPAAPADAVHAIADLHQLLPQADVVALTCPLTPETTGLIGAAALGRMKQSAILINVARGAVVDEPALIDALTRHSIAAAGLDVTAEEPLPAASPLWRLENALVTPHSAGETQAYEDNVLDILIDNIGRLSRGEGPLRNQAV